MKIYRTITITSKIIINDLTNFPLTSYIKSIWLSYIYIYIYSVLVQYLGSQSVILWKNNVFIFFLGKVKDEKIIINSLFIQTTWKFGLCLHFAWFFQFFYYKKITIVWCLTNRLRRETHNCSEIDTEVIQNDYYKFVVFKVF
jgi:hypothetical protein